LACLRTRAKREPKRIPYPTHLVNSGGRVSMTAAGRLDQIERNSCGKTSKAARINNPSEVKRVLQNFQASRQLSINVGIAILFSFRNTPLPDKESLLYYGVHE